MSDGESENEALGVEFIPAFEDARLRLDCFDSARFFGNDFARTLADAKVLYAWCMESEDNAETDVQLTEDQAACERKH